MKNLLKRMFIMIFALALVLTNNMSVKASENAEHETEGVVFMMEEPEEGSIIVSENTQFENNRKITTLVYQLQDGTVVTDTLDEGNPTMRSNSGSDTVTRQKTVSGWGTLTVTGTFDWYTKFPFSYVRCSSMSSSYSGNGEVTSTNQSRTENYVSIGKAQATASYDLADHNP